MNLKLTDKTAFDPPAGFRYPTDKTTKAIEYFVGVNDIHLQLVPVLIE